MSRYKNAAINSDTNVETHKQQIHKSCNWKYKRRRKRNLQWFSDEAAKKQKNNQFNWIERLTK